MTQDKRPGHLCFRRLNAKSAGQGQQQLGSLLLLVSIGPPGKRFRPTLEMSLLSQNSSS